MITIVVGYRVDPTKAVAIEWDRIGQLALDRHTEALLHRMFHDTGQVIVIDGRGGDDDIEVQVITDVGLRIFQLEYHSDGFWASRFT
ncbi:hypothetical protein ACGFWD_20750 [Streptomyces sp. NPDC048448]|uniref:hypothetical protein n=1 Tax=Streptomyces sp. NPDC048448 TaxID=3365554 RepID=UPI0037187625